MKQFISLDSVTIRNNADKQHHFESCAVTFRALDQLFKVIIMSYSVHQQEYENVITLTAVARYQYFLNKVADWEEVWSVGEGDGWRMMADRSGILCIPVWPARAFAEACCQGSWSQDIPKAISLSDWMTKWLPGIKSDGRQVAVFPLPTDQGILMQSDQLYLDLQEILEQFE